MISIQVLCHCCLFEARFVISWKNVLFMLENIGTCVTITWNYFPCLVLHKVKVIRIYEISICHDYGSKLDHPASSIHDQRLIESITTLWKGQGNPIRVSMICNPRRGLPTRGCCKSWTRGWDSNVPSTMWWLIIFLPRLLFLINKPISTSFYLYKAQRHGTSPCGNVMLLVMSWRHSILGAKWRYKNVVSQP